MPRKRFHSYEQYKKKWYRRLSIWARELWDGLIDFADDEGFGSADPVDLKADIFRDDNLTLEQVEEFLQELVKAQPNDPMVVIFKAKTEGGVPNSKGETEGGVDFYYWLPKFFDFQLQPDYPTPSKIANLLIHIGKLDRGDAVSTHRKFCRKSAGRRQRRARKTPKGLGVGVGLDPGVGVGKDKTLSPNFLERAEKLKTLILQNNPSAKVKDSKWGDVVRLMVERDKRTLEEIDALIEFSQGDNFEKTVVLSMGKLRERFDSLTMKMKRDKRGRESNICPGCHKPMADCFDHWWCGDCKQKHKKAQDSMGGLAKKED